MPKITLDGEYQTRDGRPVRVLCVDSKNPGLPVVAEVLHPNGSRSAEYYPADGQCGLGEYRLTPVPKKHKRTYWLVHHKNGYVEFCNRESSAKNLPHKLAITGPHEIEFTEGEGLKGADDAQAEI